MLASTLIAPVPAGLLTTLNVKDLVEILCCLGFLGAAIGLGINGPFGACQTVLPTQDLPIGNAILTFGGDLGSVLFVSASSSLFQNRLVNELKEHSPLTNATTLEDVGLSGIREVVSSDRLSEVLLGYDAAIILTLYLPVALTVVSLGGSLAIE